MSEGLSEDTFAEEVKPPPTVTITLSRWECGRLLEELVWLTCIVNRDSTDTVHLYERIATEFYGQPVRFELRRRKRDAAKTAEVTETVSWWERLWECVK